MIIIFGVRRLRKGMGPILLRCANCGMSPVALLRISTWFALFFIPVIPLSFKHYVACPNCKRLDQISKAGVDRAFAQQNAMKAGHEGFADIQRQPATLEHAVNEWASVGPAQSATTDTGPADPAAFVSRRRLKRATAASRGVVPRSRRRGQSAVLGRSELDRADDASGLTAERARQRQRTRRLRSAPDRYLPLRSRWSHPGQQQGRRMPSSSSSWVRRMRRSRVVSCLASSTQQMNSLRARGVMSFHASSAAGLATSASRRSAGSLCTTPPGTRWLLTGPR